MSQVRRNLIVNQKIYHVYNKSVGGEEFLDNKKNLTQATNLINYYQYQHKLRYSFYKRLSNNRKKDYLEKVKSQSEPIVRFYSFALMPNHYHFLVKQRVDDGIIKFISNFQNSLAKYYNLRSDRNGSLFQRPFKAKLITSDEKLLHVSRYIHLNPVTSNLIAYDELKDYPWNSFRFYLGNAESEVIDTSLILSLTSAVRYEKFVENRVDYQKKLRYIKNHLLP